MSLIKSFLAHCLLAYSLVSVAGVARAQNPPKTPPRQAEQKAIVIPFKTTIYPKQTPVIQVSINGSKPLNFLVDTGWSDPVWIHPRVAARLGLTPFGKKIPMRPGHHTVRRVRLKNLRLLGRGTDKYIDCQRNRAYVGDMGEAGAFLRGIHVDGIIGCGLLSSMIVEFDFAAQTMTLLPDTATPAVTKETAVVPIHRVQYIDGVVYTVTLDMVKTAPTELQVDTGSGETFVPKKIAAQLDPAATDSAMSLSLAGKQAYQEMLLDQFVVGSMIEPDVVVGDGDAKLGMNFLSQYRITFDFPHNQMIADRASDYAQRKRLPGLTTIVAARRHWRVIVGDVMFRSAAQMAGIRKGDRLISVDGQSVKRQILPIVQNLLNGVDRTQANIVVERANRQRLSVRYQRVSELPVSPIADFFTLTPDDYAGKWTVEDIDADSPAAKAGLKSGDEILAINNRLLSEISLEEMARLAPQNGELRVRIRHKNAKETLDISIQAANP